MTNGFSVAMRSTGALALALAFAAPAVAQTPTGGTEADIDALIDAGATNAGAIASARAQVAAGELLGAAATLERALLDRPGAGSDDVRLYYASVLCALDDRRRAAYEIGNVTHPDLPGWAEARAACGEIAAPQPTTTRGNGVWGEVSAGLAYDTDTYGALASQFDLPGVTSLKDDGLSAITGLQLDGRFGTRERSYFYGGLSFLSKDSLSGPKLDYQVGGARLGFATKLGEKADIAFGGVVRHARLFNDPFLTEYGGQVSLGLQSGKRARWSLDGEVVGQDYKGGAIASLRDGTRYDLALSYTKAPRAHTTWTVGVAGEAKDADLRNLGYRGARAFAAARLPLGTNGTYLGLSSTVRYVDYRDAAFVTDLKEWRLFGRAAVGVPLGHKGFFIEPAVSYSARLYNDAAGLRDYNSFGAELRLVYRFGK